MPKQRVTLVLPEGLWDRTKAYAGQHNRSASEVAAETLQQFLADDRQQRLAALEAIRGMRIPAGSPDEINDEIERGRLSDRP